MFRRPPLFAALLALGVIAVVDVDLNSQRRDLLPLPAAPDNLICATTTVRSEATGLRPLVALPNGQPLWFEQQPAVLSPASTEVRFDNFLVLGDQPTVRFRLFAPGQPIETWQRVETRQVGGRLVSVFNPSWDAATLAAVLSWNAWGWDQPSLYWGEVLPNGVDAVAGEPGSGRGVRLRIAPEQLPAVAVTRLSDDAQFSSHVVNLVVPDYATPRATIDDHNFSAAAIARKFYQYFEDSYDVLAIVPQDIHVADFGAYHRTLKNEVRGIGDAIYDNSAAYGSNGTLKAYEVYLEEEIGESDAVSHETAHQWAAYIDWGRLTGLQRTGHQPEYHDPLWAEGETLVGGLLAANRRIARTSDGWRIAAAPVPARFHPFTRYAMGLLPKEQVPEISLFDEQGQFEGDTTPALGAEVRGNVRTATVYNVIGMLGERDGPTPSEWRRATIVVSRRLLTAREMSYWTFLAQRSEDANGTGAIGLDGVGSFDAATDRAIDVTTAVRPRSARPLPATLDVDSPEMSESSWAGVRFDAPVKTRYRTNDLIRLSGRVTARDRGDFNEIVLYFYTAEGQNTQPLVVRAPVSANGTFMADFRFQAAHRGLHGLGIYLHWPGSGSQPGRSFVTPFIVE